MKGLLRIVATRFRLFACVLVMASTLTNGVGRAQETDNWWDPAIRPNHLPEEIIALQREAEAAERAEKTDVLREQLDLNARRWEETRRDHDRRLTEVFSAANKHAVSAAKWQQLAQMVQLAGAALNFANAIQRPSLAPDEPRKISKNDLEGEEVVLCEETECIGVSFTEALGALETAGTSEVLDDGVIQTLVELRRGFASMGPVRCRVDIGECDAGLGPAREPAWVIPFAHALRATGMRLQSMFPQAVPRLRALGRAASRLIQRSGVRSKQLTIKWNKHAVEFRRDGLATTRDGYWRLAEHYMRRPHGTYRINHSDGRTLIYDPSTNVFTSFRGDQFITMFRPGDSTAYWLRNARDAVLTGKVKAGMPAKTIKLAPWRQRVLQPKTIMWDQLPPKVRQELSRNGVKPGR